MKGLVYAIAFFVGTAVSAETIQQIFECESVAAKRIFEFSEDLSVLDRIQQESLCTRIRFSITTQEFSAKMTSVEGINSFFFIIQTPVIGKDEDI